MGLKVSGFLLDVEGTVVADKRYRPIAGAIEFVRALRERRVPLRLITNNTTHRKELLQSLLERAGFDFRVEEIHTCIQAAMRRLRELGARRCLILGTVDLRNMFLDAGFQVLQDSSSVDAVVVGLDTELTYNRLKQACDAVLRQGAAFVALHRNRVFIDGLGQVAPSVGAIVEAIVFATRVEPEIIGKPSPAYFRQTLAELDLPVSEVLVVSDDPFTDVAGAKRLGMRGAFVLSGKYPNSSVCEQLPLGERPDLVVPRIGDLLADGLLDLPPA
jgi:HAD superfamily hydrolase (TIGR01450 family)